jgi:hypothetical protein
MSDGATWSGASTGRRRWHPLFDDLFAEIFEKYPIAAAHDPCPCGLTLAVIPRCFVNPVLHFEVPDADLRDRVRALLIANHRSECRTPGPDAVLVLAEIA